MSRAKKKVAKKKPAAQRRKKAGAKIVTPAPILSPYSGYDYGEYKLDDYDKLDSYDDFPASYAWLSTIGSAIGNTFGVMVKRADKWEINYNTKEMFVGDIEEVYTRRGVLGLILNGVGRLAFGSDWPRSRSNAASWVRQMGIDKALGKHMVHLAKTIDEIRTDDKIADQYAGGWRVVDTMHAQGYEAANIALRQMAIDMQNRKEEAKKFFVLLENVRDSLVNLSNLNPASTNVSQTVREMIVSSGLGQVFDMAVQVVPDEASSQAASQLASLVTATGDTAATSSSGMAYNPQVTSGMYYFIVLAAAFPADADMLMRTLIRAYARNVTTLGQYIAYYPTKQTTEQAVIQVADYLTPYIENLRTFCTHEGSHAQYVLAKAESYYHAMSLGYTIVTPYAGYDFESTALGVNKANEVALELATQIAQHGFTKDREESIDLATQLLPLVSPFPYLDLDDKQQYQSGSGGMSNRAKAAKNLSGGGRKQKRKDLREKKKGSKNGGKRELDSVDPKKTKEKIESERQNDGGYSVFKGDSVGDLEKYAYVIGPYKGRIATTAARIARILRVNNPLGMRGAHRTGPKLNARRLYRHRLDDFRLFARPEQEKKRSYGFVVMSDLSGSTSGSAASNQRGGRSIQDEILASAFLVAEIAERIGEMVYTSLSFFSDDSGNVKRAGYSLRRGTIISDILNCESANGETLTLANNGTDVASSATTIVEELVEMNELRVLDRTIIYITDGAFDVDQFERIAQAAKKYKAAIAFFEIGSRDGGMGNAIKKHVAQVSKNIRVRSAFIQVDKVDSLPVVLAQLMKETILTSTR